MYAIKRIFIVYLFLIYQVEPVFAMNQGISHEQQRYNLTQIAQLEEDNNGQYTSPKGLVYKKNKQVNNRITHISYKSASY